MLYVIIVLFSPFLNRMVGILSKARFAIIIYLACLHIDYPYCGLFLNVFLYRLQDLSGPEILLWVVLLGQLWAEFRL